MADRWGYGDSTLHNMDSGMPSTVTSSASNGVPPMNGYHHYSHSNAFPSGYPQSTFPGQQRPYHSSFHGHDHMPQYAFPGHDHLSHSAYPHQEHPSQSAYPGQERLAHSAFPGQEHPSQSAYPGHEHPFTSVFPGQSPLQDAFPGQNRPSQNVFPGQSPPQNAFPGQPPSMHLFPGQIPSHYSHLKPPPPLIPAPHLQKQLANQQNHLNHKSTIDSIYSYPPSNPNESIPGTKPEDSNSIFKPKESDTTKPKDIDSILKPNESELEIESTPQKIYKAESEIDFAKPIFVHSKVLEKRKNSVAEVIESVIRSHMTDDSDEDSSSIKSESEESFTVTPKKFKTDPTKSENGSKKISITPFAHMDSRAIQKQKSDVLNFFPNKHKHKKTAPPKKKKAKEPKETNSALKPAPKSLQPKETSIRGLRAKAEVNYAVLDDPSDYIKNPNKQKIQPHTTIKGFKDGKVRKSPVKKGESSESDKIKTEPSDENGESSDANGEEKGNMDEVVNQFSDHPLFSILGGEEEWNEHVGETEEPEQSEHIDLSSFLDTGVSPAYIVNPNAPRNKAAPVYTSNPTEWGFPEKEEKDYSGKRYQCDYCDYGSNELTNIQTHIRGHTGEKPYKCKICNFASSRSNSIKMHMRTHTGEKPFKCDLCEKAFTKTNNLIVHRKTHTGEKDYECSLCGDRFITPDQLRKHIRSHTGEKPFKCKYCEKCFSDGSSLTRHTRIHTGEKPYECDVCGKTFSRKGTLTYHSRTHTGEKPYKCSMCPKAYILSFRLKQHMMKDHFAHIAKQAMNDTKKQMGEQMFNEMDEPDDPEEMYGAESYLEEQALEETQNIIANSMQAPDFTEDDGSDSHVKTENETDGVGNTDSLTDSEVKTEDVGNQIKEEDEKPEDEKPESAKTLYKIKTWKSVKIKKPKYY